MVGPKKMIFLLLLLVVFPVCSWVGRTFKSTLEIMWEGGNLFIRVFFFPSQYIESLLKSLFYEIGFKRGKSVPETN